jgi:NAD(P)-dependent dehydrogenase (short-subunit alcohol dehydrogenase family)
MPSALVTGGSSGIGLAIARMLRDEGYDLTLAARTVERLEQAAGALSAKAIPVDVRHEDECARLVDAHLDAHGGLDVLVNSAGVGIAGLIGDTSTKQFDLQQSVNLRSAFLVTREALPALRESRGYVVNLASIAGTIPTPGLATYGAAKAALIALTRSLVREESGTGVRATALCPGFVDTPMAAWTGIEGAAMIQPEDCAEIVRSLLRLGPAARVPVVVVERAGDDVV